MGLSSSREHRAPGLAVQIESLLPARKEFDGDMNEAIVQVPDYQAGFAGQGSMGCVTCETIANNRVFRIVRAAPEKVARVEVAHNEGNFPRFKPLSNPLLQKQSDVAQFDVSGSVPFLSGVPQKFLPRAFGERNDGVPTVHDPALQCGE